MELCGAGITAAIPGPNGGHNWLYWIWKRLRCDLLGVTADRQLCGMVDAIDTAKKGQKASYYSSMYDDAFHSYKECILHRFSLVMHIQVYIHIHR